MPNINIDDAYILNETGAQVDKVTGLYFKNENASDTEKAQARANIGAGGTNPNLLDNAYFVGGGSQLGDGVFPINQRGQSSYTGTNIGVDRWHTFDYSGSVSATLTSSGITLHFGANGEDEFAQIIPTSRLEDGATYTFSVQYQNGTIQSLTFVFSASGTAIVSSADNFRFHIIPSWGGGTFFAILNLNANARDLTIKAVKVEKGTVSTLANDAPPDFGEELRKCQRYFVRFSPKVNSRAYIGTGSANNSNNMLIFVPTPVTLRTTPTVSFSMCNCYNWVVGGAIGINNMTLDSWSDNGVFVRCVPADASQAPQGQPYALRVASGGFFDLSCEL